MMDRLKHMVADALLELKDAALGIKNDDDYDEVKLKYDVSFLGEKDNILESAMLSFALEYYFDLVLLDEQLNDILPYVCDEIGLKCEPNDLPEEDLAANAYLIHLF